MSALAAFLRRTAQRQARRPELLEALLLGRGGAYARHRLGAVLVRLLLRTALHTFEVLFLSRVLPFEYLTPLLSYRALAGFLGSLHWGASEGLRARVRETARVHRPARARRAIEGWLCAGGALCAVPIGLLGTRALYDLFGARSAGLSLFDAYGLACFIRLALDVYARTFHAGIFALRRVYRPLVSLLGVDLLELAVIVFAFERYGAWAIPIAIVLAGALDALFTVHYAARAYRRQRLPVPAPLRNLLHAGRGRRAGFRLVSLPAVLRGAVGLSAALRGAGGWSGALRGAVGLSAALRGAVVHSAANATLQLDALLLLLLLRVDPPRREGASLALLYYVLRPLLGLGAQWVRTFYFDLSRIEGGPLRAFRPRLLRLLGRLALGCAFGGALLTLGVAELLWPGMATPSWLWLAPFFLMRSLFALAQLQAFTAGRLRALLWVSALFALGLGLLALVAQSGEVVLAGAALLLGLGVFALRETGGRFERSTRRSGWIERAGSHAAAPDLAPARGQVLGLGEFLRELRASDPVQLAVLSVARRSAQVGKVLQALLALGPGVRIARCARSHVLLFAPADPPLSRGGLIAASGGALERLWLSAPGPALEGIGLARAQGALPSELHDALGPSAPERRGEQLSGDFRRSFPAGVLLDLEAGTGALDPSVLPRPLLGAFVRQLIAASHQRERELRAKLPLQLAVYAPGGRASLVFVVAAKTPGFATFRSRVRAASLRASLYAGAGVSAARAAS